MCHVPFSMTLQPSACSDYQNLYPGIEEIGFNCHQPVDDSELHISMLQTAQNKRGSERVKTDGNHWAPYCQPDL